MAFDAHKNLATATVAAGGAPSPATSGTSLTVAAGTGARFPTAPFNATCAPPNTLPDPTNSEIVRVTTVTGDVLTVARAQEGTTAQSIGNYWQVTASITAKTLTDIEGPVAGALQAANNLSDLTNAANARANLGLGSAALQPATAFDAAGAAAAAQAASLQKSANLSDLASPSAARGNLGLGGAAVLNVGKTTGTVAAGDDERFFGPYRFYPGDYGAKGDARIVTDGAMTNGSAVLTCATSLPFTAADVGKAICVPLAKSANSDLQATILSFTDSGHVTLSVAATATVTNARLIWGSDDTSAIASCVAAAVSYAQTSGGYAEVIFSDTLYMLAGAPTAGSSGTCNAQIPLDMVPSAAQKVTVVLRGSRAATHLYHWLQTTPQVAGPTLCTIWTPGTNGGTSRNQRSVVGGPIPSLGGAGVFSNMHIVVDGLTISTPANSQIAGFDFRMIAEATVLSAAALARSNVTGAPTIPNLSLGGINDFAFGLWMPMTGNNALCDVVSFSAEGMVYGFVGEEHCQVSSLRVVNCYDGLVVWPSGGGAHGNTFGYVCAENNVHQVLCAGGYPQLDIQCLDIEQTGSPQACIQDTATTTATGRINVVTNGTSASVLAVLNNATYKPVTTGIRVYDAAGIQGVRTPPAVPASTVALQNPFWRDCAVTVTGGTVTVIAVDGTATGITSGTVFVPTGKTITLTYSVAPTWVWVAL